MITSFDELKTAVEDAGTLLQNIHHYLQENPEHEQHARIRFPRGYLRTNASIRKSFGFVKDDTLRSNISYAIMTHEVLRWIVVRTDLSGQARDMMIKEGICLLASICESLTIHPSVHGLGRKSSFSKRVGRLLEDGVITEETQADLIWLWDKRRNEHLYEVEVREYDHYEIKDWNRSVKAFDALRKSLASWL